MCVCVWCTRVAGTCSSSEGVCQALQHQANKPVALSILYSIHAKPSGQLAKTVCSGPAMHQGPVVSTAEAQPYFLVASAFYP